MGEIQRRGITIDPQSKVRIDRRPDGEFCYYQDHLADKAAALAEKEGEAVWLRNLAESAAQITEIQRREIKQLEADKDRLRAQLAERGEDG